MTFEQLNSAEGKATFYINGIAQGETSITESFTWEPEKVKIFLGLNYVGDLDDVAIFNKALSQREVMALNTWRGGLKRAIEDKQ